MEKTMSEMTNKELFSVLAGSRGIMPQMMLKKAVRAYRKRQVSGSADLRTMVQAYISSGYQD